MRADGPILTSTEILISPEDDAEVRRVSSDQLGAQHPGDRAHELCRGGARRPGARRRASGVLEDVRADRVRRGRRRYAARHATRSREPGERRSGCSTSAVLEGEGVGALQFETDRARFLGRGGDVRTRGIDRRRACRCPIPPAPCSIRSFALRRRVRIPPGGTARVDFWTGVAGSRAQALAAAGKYRDARRIRADLGRRPRAGRAVSSRSSRSTRMMRADFSALQATCCTPIARCAPRSRFLRATSRGRRFSGRAVYRAICPSCWCISRPAAAASSSGSSCGRASTGGRSALSVDLVS